KGVLRGGNRAVQRRTAAILESAPETGARGAQHVDLVGEDGLLVGQHHFAVVGLEVIAGSPLGVVGDQGVSSRASVYHCLPPANPLDFDREFCQLPVSENTYARRASIAVRPLQEHLPARETRKPRGCLAGNWSESRPSRAETGDASMWPEGAAGNNNRS